MKFISRKIFFIVTCIFLTNFAQAIEERVVATVDGYPIMQSQVIKSLGKRKNTETNRKKVIDEIINDYLIQRAVNQSGIKITTAYIDQVIEDMVVQNGITYGQFLDYLDYNNITLDQYRRQISHQILMENVKQQAIGQSIKVEPEDVHSLAEKLQSEAKAKGNLKKVTGLQYRVSHILIKTNPILNDNQAKAQLNNIIADIKAGKTTFAQAAKVYSVDYASGSEGGDLGWNFLDTYDPAFAKVAKNSKIGAISAPFKSQFGWHILKVVDTRQNDRTDDAYLQKAYEQLVNKQAQEASKDWVKALKNNAEIKYY